MRVEVKVEVKVMEEVRVKAEAKVGGGRWEVGGGRWEVGDEGEGDGEHTSEGEAITCIPIRAIELRTASPHST